MQKMAEYKTVGFGDISFLVQRTGLSDPALRLVIGLLSAYPFAFIYRLFLYRKNPFLQHVYFTLAGVSLICFCYGWGIIHSLFNILLVYVVLFIGGPNIATVIGVFILNMSYLIWGYLANATSGYDINWTTPHCLLCLKLTSLAWDYYDGAQNQETLSEDFKKTGLKKLPSFIEVLGSSYFMGSCLVGPLFPIKLYIQLVEGDLIDKEIDNNSCLVAGLKRLLAGLIYLGLYSTLGLWFTDSYMVTDEFKSLSFFSQVWYIGFWGRVFLMRYLGVWITAEGSCIITGLCFNGKTPQGELIWDGLRNIKLSIYIPSYTYQHIVECFNVNTNKWVFRYCFKRLRFLGNKNLSHFLTLMFLAIWHGFHVGYFICFFLEFLIILMERQVYNTFAALFKMRWADMSVPLKALAIAVAWPIRFCGFGYCIVPFNLLTWSKMKGVLHTTYYWVPLAIAIWYALYPTIIGPLTKLVTKTAKDQSKEKLKKAE